MYGLTEAQQTICYRPATTMSVFAAPGSGKTTVLTNHILYQLQDEGVSPEQMMAVTFTKQAAKEMKDRLQRQMTSDSRSKCQALHLGTFHAQMFAMLLHHDPNVPVLLDPREQSQMIRTSLQLQSLSDTPEDVRKRQVRLTLMRSTWPPMKPSTRREKRFYEQYQRLKTLHHRWDFDDILVQACSRLEQAQSTFWSRGLRYILMDEFQDTNAIQWQIVRYLAAEQNAHLFVVGDDDQSIYGFRGANPEWLIHFNRWFPNAVRGYLTTNFRSDKAIVRSAGKLIAHNLQRTEKAVTGASTAPGKVELLRTHSETTEATTVVHLVLESCIHKSVAVLARTRRQLEVCWCAFPAELRQKTEFRTFHDAKGKEWDIVHIVGAVHPNPYLRTPTNEKEFGDEEERRIFYVAMTRARHELYIHVPEFVGGHRCKPIRFLGESGLDTGKDEVSRFW